MSANQPKLVRRQHGQHNHQMTIANPGKDTRDMYIPSGTIVPDTPRSYRLPFPFLRTWIMSLLALVGLPVGLMLIVIAMNFLDSGQPDWVEQTATVTRVQDSGITYRWDVSGKAYDATSGVDFERATSTSAFGSVTLTMGVCDLVAWWIIPTEQGATFPLWVNPMNPLEAQCVPVTQDSAGIMLFIGGVLVVFFGLRLLRTFSAAAMASTRR